MRARLLFFAQQREVAVPRKSCAPPDLEASAECPMVCRAKHGKRQLKICQGSWDRNQFTGAGVFRGESQRCEGSFLEPSRKHARNPKAIRHVAKIACQKLHYTMPRSGLAYLRTQSRGQTLFHRGYTGIRDQSGSPRRVPAPVRLRATSRSSQDYPAVEKAFAHR
jgi:hypothetical protein